MKEEVGTIFTPQGLLSEVEHDPKIDLLMNIFNIPRAFSVSGFGGNWDVGRHSFATALIALYWSRHNGYDASKRNKLVTLALLHDIHEAATGDILPMLKNPETRERLDSIQDNILNALGVEYDPSLKTDLKIIDIIAFIYEIKQVSPSVINKRKLALAHKIADAQLSILLSYAEKSGVSKKTVEGFLDSLDIL